MARDQVSRQLPEHLDQLPGVFGQVVLAAGRVRDRHQRLLVDRSTQSATGATEAAAAEPGILEPLAAVAGLAADLLRAAPRSSTARILRPEPDRVDADPGRRQTLRG